MANNSLFNKTIEKIKLQTDYMTELQKKQLMKFIDGAVNIKPSGNGNRIHTRLLGLANHASMAGLDEETCFTILREHVHGDRCVSDAEIWSAIEKAWLDHEECETTPQSTPTSKLKSMTTKPSAEQTQALLKARDHLIKAGRGITMHQIREMSPIKLSLNPKRHLADFLQALYLPDEMLYLGDTYGKNVYQTQYLINAIPSIRSVAEHIIPNPFSGTASPSKSGKLSKRCDAAVSSFKYAIAEFDDISLEDQLAFWSQVDLPIVALIYSGSKSIHAWLRINGVSNEEEWTALVRDQLYGQFLIPMGVDRSCSNPSRLSRTPGHHRKGKKDQHCFYLAPEGKAVRA